MAAALQIAIDGPVGAGKSDIAATLARKLGILYLYTGAMYRALAYACLKKGIHTKDDETAIVGVLQELSIELKEPANTQYPVCVIVDGIDVTEHLFTPELDQLTSDISTIATVRKQLVARQQELAHGKNVVMEGRDIGLRVLPDAQLKVYLTATPEERAKRRLAQWESKGIAGKTFDQALNDIKVRDEQDMNRAVDPLQKLPDSWELDTTRLSKNEVVDAIIGELKHRELL